MRIERLRVYHVRNLQDVSLEPAPRLNFLCGPNTSGKTALLEAIFLLARGRSFRTARLADVITRGCATFQVTAHLDHGQAGNVVAGVERGNGHLALRFGGETIDTVSAFARRFPVVVATPDSHELVSGTPKVRRNWLDWAMFHVEPRYLEYWREYHRALRHRNSALKQRGSDRELAGWEQVMAPAGEALHGGRQVFVERLHGVLEGLGGQIGSGDLGIRLAPGWNPDRRLLEELESGRKRDREVGYTQCGPHRADLVVEAGGNAVAASFSRGQAKLLVSVLAMALARVVAEMGGENPVLLLDDYDAELDRQARQRLLQLLDQEGLQAFLSSTEWVGEGAPPVGSAMFHVERGEYTKVVE
jgi:DNA replication and repair protein RecF